MKIAFVSVLLKQLELIWWFISTFWWLFPPIAVLMWIIIMSMARTVMNRVLYIRKGGTMSFHRCVIQGTNIKFRPEKSRKSRPRTVNIQAPPYTFVKGLNTMRVYVVTEGGGQTVRFPTPDKEGKLANVKVDEASTHPKDMVAAASVSLFDQTINDILENLPKSKVQYLMVVLWIVMGVMVGLGWGILAGKLGWV